MIDRMRPFTKAHLAEAAELCRREIPHLPWTTEILVDRIFDDPDFDPELNPTAWRGGRLVGLACGAPPNVDLQTAGGVKLFAVAHDMTRQGIAGQLLDHIEDRLAASGALESFAVIAGNNRFMQGLDLRYTAALCFLEARGYGRVGDGMDMDVKLTSLSLDTTEVEAVLAETHGVRLRRATRDDYDSVWAYAERTFDVPRPEVSTVPVGRRWAYLATSGLRRNPPTLHVAERLGEITGFTVTDVAAPGRLGPMGVSSELRGLGVGAVLLKRGLADLRSQGLETGVIYGAGPYAFYATTVGAVANAVFWILRKELI